MTVQEGVDQAVAVEARAAAAGMSHTRTVERALFWTIVLLFVVFVGISGARIAFNIDLIPWSTLVLLFGSIGLLHANYLLGPRRAFTMFGVTLVISFAAEMWGVKAGILFGPYVYTDLFGVKLLGVPLIMPFAYFMQAYPCYLMVNLLTEGRFVAQRGSLVWLLWLSLLGGMMMTAWDLTIDPLMSCNPNYPATAGMCDAIKPAWHWLDGGPYFGVPSRNFIGWMITTTSIYLVYRLIERSVRHDPFQRHYSHLLLLPIVGYAILTLSDTFIAEFEPVRIIAPFVMGIAATASLMRVLGPDGGQRTMSEIRS